MSRAPWLRAQQLIFFIGPTICGIDIAHELEVFMSPAEACPGHPDFLSLSPGPG